MTRKSPNSEVRLAMIGCGMISTKYFQQAETLDNVRFVATCSRTEASARTAAELHGCEHWFTDYQSLLEWSKFDAVVIATPHWLHVPIALAAVNVGKHILVEKPFATPSQWEIACEVVKIAEQKPCTLMVMPYDQCPEFLAALHYTQMNIIGPITAVEAELSMAGPSRSNWYYTRKSEGGASLDTLIYALSHVAAIMGPAKEVTAMINTLIPKRICGDGGMILSEVDDNVSLLLSYPTGQHAVVRSCWGYTYFTDALAVHGRYGDIFFNFRWPNPVVIHTNSGRPQGTLFIDFLYLENCYAVDISPFTTQTENALSHFVTCIRTGTRPQNDGRLALHLLEQTCLAFESARVGRTLPLKSSFERWWPIEASLFDLGDRYW